jgi:hypothetical protein
VEGSSRQRLWDSSLVFVRHQCMLSSLASRTVRSLQHVLHAPRAFSTSPQLFKSSTATMAATHLVNKTAHPFQRAALEAVLIQRFFYCPAFEIYGGEPPQRLLPFPARPNSCR